MDIQRVKMEWAGNGRKLLLVSNKGRRMKVYGTEEQGLKNCSATKFHKHWMCPFDTVIAHSIYEFPTRLPLRDSSLVKFQGDEFGGVVGCVDDGALEAIGEPERTSRAEMVWRRRWAGSVASVGAGIAGKEIEIVDGDEQDQA